MIKVEMYTKNVCPYCTKAKELLKIKGLDFSEHNIETSAENRAEMLKKAPSSRTVPQIFINDVHIGGYDDLNALDKSGELDEIIKANS